MAENKTPTDSARSVTRREAARRGVAALVATAIGSLGLTQVAARERERGDDRGRHHRHRRRHR
jgi:hypothetical protein